MWVVTHRSIAKDHLAAMPFQLFNQEYLMQIFARQPIWRGDQDDIEGRLSRLIPKLIEPWAIETSATIAVITVDMLLGETPTVLLN